MALASLPIADDWTLSVVGEHPWQGRTSLRMTLSHPRRQYDAAFAEDSVEHAGVFHLAMVHAPGEEDSEGPGWCMFSWGPVAQVLAQVHAQAARPGAVARLAQLRLRPFTLSTEASRLAVCIGVAHDVLLADDPSAHTRDATLKLATELMDRMTAFQAFTWCGVKTPFTVPEGTSPDVVARREADSMLWLDAEPPPPSSDGTMLLLDELRLRVLESVGDENATKARKRYTARWSGDRDQPLALWKDWLEGDRVPEAVRKLALSLWRYRVKPALEEAEKKRPALAMVVHGPVTDLLAASRKATLAESYTRQRLITLPGDLVVTVRQDLLDTVIAPGDARKALVKKASARVEKGISELGSLLGHKTIRHVVREGHRQALEQHPDPRVLSYEGGYTGLGEVLGASKKEIESLTCIIEALNATEFPLPDYATPVRLLSRELTKATGQRRSRLNILLGTALLPNYVHDLKRHGLTGRPIRLVPLLDEPPMVGRLNEYAAQATLSMVVVEHMRDNARELVARGGLPLPHELLRRMADRAGLPRSFDLQRMLDAWLAGADRRPAFLRQTEPGRYTLGTAHERELDFILAGGQHESDSSSQGKRAVHKREQAAARGRKPRGK